MGAKINLIKEFFGVSAKKVSEAAKEVKEAPKEIKEISEESMKTAQAAEGSYGMANVAMQKTASGKKVYVKPNCKEVNIKNEKPLMQGSQGTGTNTIQTESGPSGNSGYDNDPGSAWPSGSRPSSPYDSFWDDLTN